MLWLFPKKATIKIKKAIFSGDVLDKSTEWKEEEQKSMRFFRISQKNIVFLYTTLMMIRMISWTSSSSSYSVCVCVWKMNISKHKPWINFT